MSNPANAAPQSTPDKKPTVSNEAEFAPEIATGIGNTLTTDLPLSPRHVLQLQRAIGNRATAQLIGRQATPAIQREGGPVRPTQAPPYVARPGTSAPTAKPSIDLPSWLDFYDKVQAAAIPARDLLNQPNAPASEDAIDSERDELLKEVLQLYRTYDQYPFLKNLVKLYHKLDHWVVMYWNHEDLRKLGLKTDKVMGVFNATKATIEAKVKLEIAKSGASQHDVANALKMDSKIGQKAARIKFFEDVGVPIEFYAQLSSKHVALFKQLYKALDKKKTQDVPGIIAALKAQNIVGFPIIKGLFLTKFPGVAGIENLLNPNYVASKETKESAYALSIKNADAGGMTPQEMANEEYADNKQKNRDNLAKYEGGAALSQNLTRAELAALVEYTGNLFEQTNKGLRDNDLSAPDPRFKQLADSQRNKSAVIVSALNKLPAYSGLAYRMQNGWADFDVAVKPGGLFTDLAFMSASMTAEGAELGGASGGATKPGALEVFEIIHSKSARVVTILSSLSHETEVLFPPGVRFYVKAIWKHINGKIPKDAPMEAQMILMRNGDIKKRQYGMPGQEKTMTGTVRVVELIEA